MKQKFFLDAVYCNREGGAVSERDHFTFYLGFILGLQTVPRWYQYPGDVLRRRRWHEVPEVVVLTSPCPLLRGT